MLGDKFMRVREISKKPPADDPMTIRRDGAGGQPLGPAGSVVTRDMRDVDRDKRDSHGHLRGVTIGGVT